MASRGAELNRLNDFKLALVTSYGRSGSSRLMELIKRASAGAVAGKFPYETRSVQFGILCSTGAGQIAADGTITYDHFAYAAPSRRLDGENETEFRHRILREVAYLRPYTQDGRSFQSQVIVEKSVGLQIVDHVLGSCPNTSCILLNRDPRDVFLSVLAFNTKRDSVSFGAEQGPLVLAQRIAGYFAGATSLLSRHRQRIRVVRYSEIVTDPLGAVSQALDSAVGVDAIPRAELLTITNPSHVTADDVKSSLARWRDVAEQWPGEFMLLKRAYDAFQEQSTYGK